MIFFKWAVDFKCWALNFHREALNFHRKALNTNRSDLHFFFTKALTFLLSFRKEEIL